MRNPSTPGSNDPPRARTRGAIRTHLGRKRVGPRARPLGNDTMVRMQEAGEAQRHRQEQLFDRLRVQFQGLFDAAGERTAAALDAALDTACDTLVAAGEFTADNAERLRQLVRRDLLHRDHPSLTFRTGDITSAGTLTCENCGWSIVNARTTQVPACPKCAQTHFRKSA